MSSDPNAAERGRRRWDRFARDYDRTMIRAERRLLGEHRDWVCGQADGEVLEVAVGTGLNLPRYSPGVRLHGLDLSPEMLRRARSRAAEAGITVELREGDAMDLPYEDGRFDAVVCTYSLCAVPDDAAVLVEMARVLRPGGVLLLVDHIGGRRWPVRAAQWLLERVTVPTAGEHYLRRPSRHVPAAGLAVEEIERFRWGVVERLRARKPA